jgi:hypothetical protein
MKISHFKSLLITFVFIAIQFTTLTGKSLDFELKKNFMKEFTSDRSTVLELSNRYGKIDIKTWDKSSVKIDVTVIIKASSKSKAEDKMEQISINLAKNGSNIVGVTEIGNKEKSWWSGWTDFGNNTKMEINYEVFMPADMTSIIENKYGNVYLPDLKGKTSINLKYGNLQARDISNDLLMDISYGKATVGIVKNLSGTLSYSDYRGTAAGVVILTTKYSKVNLDNVSTLTASSKYDGYKLGSAGTVTLTGSYDDVQIQSVNTATLTTKYTGIDIASLSNTLTAEIGYGSLKIENLKTTLKNITVNSSYAPIKIYGTVPAKVDISGKYFDADLGSDFISKSNVKDGSSKTIKGFKISEKASAEIKIKTSYGDVTIR